MMEQEVMASITHSLCEPDKKVDNKYRIYGLLPISIAGTVFLGFLICISIKLDNFLIFYSLGISIPCYILFSATERPKRFDKQTRLASEKDYPDLHLIVGDICKKSMVKKCEIRIKDVSDPDSFVYGSPWKKRVAITTGLLKIAVYGELYSCILHEIAHIKHRDVTLFSLLYDPIKLLREMSVLAREIGHSFTENKKDASIGALFGLALFYFLAILIYIIFIIFNLSMLAFQRSREYYADDFAVTTIPNGRQELARLLVKIEMMKIGLAYKINDYTFIDNMIKKLKSKKMTLREKLSTINSTHPCLIKRLQRL